MNALTEYIINDKTYVDIKDIRTEFKTYCKGTRSIPQLIERKGYHDIIYGIIVNGDIQITQTMSRKNGTTFVNKSEVAELFNVPKEKLSPVPPIINDKDLVFFKNEEGEEYNVLMRGERTRKGIFFRVKDVERCFEIPELSKTLQRDHTGYRNGIHYAWFTMSSGDAVPNRHNKKNELYLTYEGLMRVIYRSNSGVASEFRCWIDECVFAMNWGTKDQKAKVVSRALNVDANHLKAIMNKCSGSITCLYLIDIDIKDGDRRVFKYGFTNDLKRRFSEHMSTYGKEIKLEKFIFIPELDLSTAEATFRDSVSGHRYFAMENRNELISLCDKGFENVQTIFSTIMSKHCGNFREINALFESEKKDYEAKLIIKDEQCKRFMAEKQSEVYKLQIELLELKLQIQKGSSSC